MILHCVACSMNATRPMRESEIAVIDEEKLRLPLEGSMFLDLDPVRGIPKRLAGEIFREMKCLRHGGPPWGMNPKESMAAAKLGGPWRIFTDQGWLRINKQGFVQSHIVRDSMEKPPGEEAEKPIRCMTCGKRFKNQMALNGHVKVHRRKVQINDDM